MYMEEIKIRIERVFGRKISVYQELSSGYVNNLFILKIDNDTYIAKVYNEHLPIGQVLFSIGVQRYLSRMNLSPQILAVLDDAIPLISIQEYAASYCTSPNDDYSCGLLLGNIHRKLYYYRDSLATEFEITGIPQEMLSRTLSSKQKILLEKKIKLSHHINLAKTIEKQIIHGDYHSGNIINSDYGYVLIDFDESKIYYRVYDVIKVIINLIRKFGLSKSKEYADIFLLGYGQHIQLLDQEIESMVDIYISALSTETSGLGNEKNNLDEQYLDKRIALHEFVLSEEKNIRNFVSNLSNWR